VTEYRYLFLYALLVTIATFLIDEWAAAPPAARPASVPAGEYSGERAYTLLSEILSDRVPHAVGTDANKRVRSRIEDFLRRNGIDYAIQRDWGCSRRGRNQCAWTENIVARIPGARDGPYVALMAHYDSVPMAPGAGDDGAGLVTVLESARILKGEAPHRNPLMLVLTDAEEMGLLGAAAFFRANPLATEIGVILNLDGAGTTGPSVVLRTAGDSSTLIATYHDAARFPSASSLTDEVFKRMPNDTDFSMSQRAGVPGIDFAFAGEFAHYHTPNDNLDNIDKRTLQHDGENTLPTARRLLDMDLTPLAVDSTRDYLQIPGGIWLDWPPSANAWWLALAGLVLLGVLLRERLFGHGWRRPVIVFGGPLVVLLAAGVVGFGAFELISLSNGTMPGWPATLWPFRLVLFSAPALGALAVTWGIYRNVGVGLALAGAWCWWWLLALGTAVAMPGAAIVFLAPLLVAAAMLLAASLVSSRVARTVLLLGTLVFAVSQTLSSALALEETQGYRIIFVSLPFIAFFLVVSVPMARGRSAAAGTGAALLLTLVGIAGATAMPLYSAWRPQHVNIHYVENLDAGTARVSLESPNTLPQFMLDTLDFDRREQAIYPWAGVTVDNVATVAPSGWSPPRATVLASEIENGTRVVHLSLQLQRPALSMTLVLPAAANVQRFVLDGIELQPVELAGRYFIRLIGMNDRPVRLEVDMGNTEPVDASLFDSSTELPASLQPLLKVRPPLASPVHQGDSALLARTIRL
jgi:hypothetical protein